MAKNISKNQWFKNIIDNVYLNTAVLNDILIITVFAKTNDAVPTGTTIATIRNPELFVKSNDGNITNYQGRIINVVKGNITVSGVFNSYNSGFVVLQLKNKQLETDFYSPEQLAEMFPDNPAYQIATDELTDEIKPVVDPVEDMEVT